MFRVRRSHPNKTRSVGLLIHQYALAGVRTGDLTTPALGHDAEGAGSPWAAPPPRSDLGPGPPERSPDPARPPLIDQPSAVITDSFPTVSVAPPWQANEMSTLTSTPLPVVTVNDRSPLARTGSLEARQGRAEQQVDAQRVELSAKQRPELLGGPDTSSAAGSISVMAFGPLRPLRAVQVVLVLGLPVYVLRIASGRLIEFSGGDRLGGERRDHGSAALGLVADHAPT